MLSSLNISLDKEHRIIKDVLCSFSKINALRGQNAQYRLDGNLKKLNEVYSDTEFRHKYSSLFLIITNIDKTSTLDLDFLMDSMQKTLFYVLENKSKYSDNFIKSFLKLYDHIMLEIMQINYMKEIDKKGEMNSVKAADELKRATKLSEEATKNIKASAKKLNNIEKEHITILGIFAAIVLAFVAGISFSNSTLSNIHQVSIYRLSFIVCLIGFFTINLLYFLFDFIKEIHFGESYKEEKSYINIAIFNGVVLFIFITIAVFWYCNAGISKDAKAHQEIKTEINITKEQNITKLSNSTISL